MYDPMVGRFLEEDPIDFAPGDPNLHRYVKNSPTNATDPSGMWLVAPNDEVSKWRKIEADIRTELRNRFPNRNYDFQFVFLPHALGKSQVRVSQSARSVEVYEAVVTILGRNLLEGDVLANVLNNLYGGSRERATNLDFDLGPANIELRLNGELVFTGETAVYNGRVVEWMTFKMPELRAAPARKIGGPDVTDWFEKEADIWYEAAKERKSSVAVNNIMLIGKWGPKQDYKARRLDNAPKKPYFPDWPGSFDANALKGWDPETVTLGGKVVHLNQLGNITLGIIAEALDSSPVSQAAAACAALIQFPLNPLGSLTAGAQAVSTVDAAVGYGRQYGNLLTPDGLRSDFYAAAIAVGGASMGKKLGGPSDPWITHPEKETAFWIGVEYARKRKRGERATVASLLNLRPERPHPYVGTLPPIDAKTAGHVPATVKFSGQHIMNNAAGIDSYVPVGIGDDGNKKN
jgi:hypothetical protein